MATETKCPHCGKPVPTTALGGICPECMLKAGVAETGEIGPDGTAVAKPQHCAALSAVGNPRMLGARRHGRGL
jgi:NMD protein affecting ribosome stability and mRNA decay